MLLTSPFLLMVVMHAKARRVVVRATLSVLLPLLRAAARALGVLPSADADPNARVVEDPDLPVWLAGVSSLVAAERRAKKQLWEWWLDALRFSPDSPGRAHIRQLLLHPETARKLEALFDALDTETRGTLDKDALVRFSAGIRGTVRVLLDRERASADGAGRSRHGLGIELEPATARESTFLIENFDLLFPNEHPLDLDAFLSMAKLVLVRRIVKALVKRHGLQTVRAGMRAPVVVDVSVVDEKNRALFRVHTVAPSTAPGVDGHRLGAISESPVVPAGVEGEADAARRARGSAPNPKRKGKFTKKKKTEKKEKADAFDPGAPLRMSDVWAEARAIEAGEDAGSSDEDTEEASWSDYS